MMMYTVFVIELHSRRVQVVVSTPHPNEAFMLQMMRELTARDSMLSGKRLFLCDRDRKWSLAVRELLERSVCTSFRLRSVRRIATHTRSGSSARSKKSA